MLKPIHDASSPYLKIQTAQGTNQNYPFHCRTVFHIIKKILGNYHENMCDVSEEKLYLSLCCLIDCNIPSILLGKSLCDHLNNEVDHY